MGEATRSALHLLPGLALGPDRAAQGAPRAYPTLQSRTILLLPGPVQNIAEENADAYRGLPN